MTSTSKPGFGFIQQFAVFQFFPASGAGFRDGVAIDQIAGKGARCAVIEQNQHLGADGRCPRATRRELQNSLNLVARDAEFLHQFVNAHVLEVLEHRGYRRSGAF